MMKYTPGENQFFNYFLQRNAIILLKLENFFLCVISCFLTHPTFHIFFCITHISYIIEIKNFI